MVAPMVDAWCSNHGYYTATSSSCPECRAEEKEKREEERRAWRLHLKNSVQDCGLKLDEFKKLYEECIDAGVIEKRSHTGFLVLTCLFLGFLAGLIVAR